MKNFYLVALAAIFLFAACSKEGGNTTSNDGKAVIGVQFDPSIIYNPGRSLDPIEDNKQERVSVAGDSKVYVYFFGIEGQRIGQMIEEDAKDLTVQGGKKFDTENYGVSNKIYKVVIIANAPAGWSSNDASITSYEALKKTFVNAEALNALYDEVLEGDTKAPFWLSGEHAGITWSKNGDESTASATVDLSPIFARIDVKVNLSGVSKGLYGVTDKDTDPRIRLKSVDLLYGATYGTFADAPSVLADFVNEDPPYATSGLVPVLTNNYWESWKNALKGKTAKLLGNEGDFYDSSDWTDNIMHGNFSTSVADPAAAFAKSFYVFPNATDADAVILALYGEKDKTLNNPDNGKEPAFWSVHFDGTPQGSGDGVLVEKLKKGYVYTITLSLTGDLSMGDKGEPDPEEEVNAGLTIMVDKMQWKGVVEIGNIIFE